jgi:hypothetical protein
MTGTPQYPWWMRICIRVYLTIATVLRRVRK